MSKFVGSFGAILFAGLLLGSLSAVQAQVAVNPASPQPAADQLKPGLAVRYYFDYFRHIDEMIEFEDFRDGKVGEPILELNYKVGQGNVLTSDSNDAVGAKMTGYILLDQPGTYSFAFLSNDGVRLEIDGKMILEDPGVHSDQYSDFGSVTVTEPGWYPILIRYYERKNTSTIIFFWRPPGVEGTMPIVPGAALAHGS